MKIKIKHTTTTNGAQYKIYGTNQPYTGRVVQIGNRMFTTEGGGALEGILKLLLNKPDVGNSGEDLVTLNTPYVQPQQMDKLIV